MEKVFTLIKMEENMMVILFKLLKGEYLNDKKHGTGAYFWADGRRYEG
jgi:hypothetical protein